MKNIKLLILFILISVQANATGYSNNMFVAQRMLKAKKVLTQIEPVAAADGTVARIASFNKLVAFDLISQPASGGMSVIQCISEWMVQMLGVEAESNEAPILKESVRTELTIKKKISSCLGNYACQLASSLQRLLF